MYKLLVLITSTVINAVIACAQSDISNTTCDPFRLLVIWHTSNGEDVAFIEQKRLIIQLLLNIPQGTEIQVTAINTQRYHLLHFKKNETTDWKDWIYNISMYNPDILENHNITDSLINETVFSFRKQNDKKEVAELTVLVVSEKTLTEDSLETIKNIKTCVVFTGLNPPPPLLTYLVTDRQHVVKLNTTTQSIEDNIKGTANKVLDLLCRDSRLICDTDEFWTGKRCVNCLNICSADTKKHLDKCLDSCRLARAQSDISNTTCDPFRLLVIWHTSNGEDVAFIEQKRLIIQLLLNIPQGTEIHVTAINTRRHHLLHFKKDKTTDWIYNISMYNPEILENHNITDSLINETVFSFRKQNDKKEVAELTVLVVSEKTLTENSLETIKNIKTCVVFTGLNPPPPLWTSLATDRQHVVKLNTTSKSIMDNIDGTANTVLDLLCRDSRLICDTDEFWIAKRCVNCSKICSADTKQLSDTCLDVCPYYRQPPLKNADNEVDKKIQGTSTSERFKPNNDWISISLLLLLSVFTTVAFAFACVFWRRVRMLKQYSTAYIGRNHPVHQTSRTDEQIELRAQQEILHL